MHTYPKSHIPTQPVLSSSSFLSGRRSKSVSSVLDAGTVKFVTSGRVAIALAMKHMGIGPGDKVLVPAYHCASMVQPVIWAGATPVFFRVRPDTTVDLDDVQSKMDGSTKALMATNYFGFPQDLTGLRRFCDDRKLYFLEDCAHSFLGEHRGKPLGSYGDFAIASAMKFFPVYEGGCLVSSRHDIGSLELNSAGLGFEVKATFNALEKSFSFGRMAGLKAALSAPMWLKNFLWSQVKRSTPSKSISLGPGSSDGGFNFDPKWLMTRASLFSRVMINTVPTEPIARKRRENYQMLLEALSDVPHFRPLFPDLPENVVPYVFPMVSENLPTLFPVLKNAGVPIIRFAEYLTEGVDASVCASSVALSTHCMQLPCHQDLKPEELQWIIEKFRAITQSAGSNPP